MCFGSADAVVVHTQTHIHHSIIACSNGSEKLGISMQTLRQYDFLRKHSTEAHVIV